MKICPNCRDSMIDSKKVCPTCHYEFSDDSIKKAVESNAKKENKSKEVKNNNHKKIGIKILVILLMIDLVFAAISLFVDIPFALGLATFVRQIFAFTELIVLDVVCLVICFIACFIIYSYTKNEDSKIPLGIKVFCLLVLSVPLGVLLFTTD